MFSHHLELIVACGFEPIDGDQLVFPEMGGFTRTLRTCSPRGLCYGLQIKVEKANTFVDRCIKSCHVVAEADGFFMSEHSEDLSTVEGEQPGSMVGQWPEVLELIPACGT